MKTNQPTNIIYVLVWYRTYQRKSKSFISIHQKGLTTDLIDNLLRIVEWRNVNLMSQRILLGIKFG